MCYGCMSYESATNLVNKQLDFLNKSDDEQKELMKDNQLSNNDFIHDYTIAVENLLPFSEWSKAKLELYMYLSTSERGLVAQFSAIKLLVLYEQFVINNDSEKYKLFKEMLEKNTKTLSKMDKLRLEKEKQDYENQKQDYENQIQREEYHRKLKAFNSFPKTDPSIFSLSYWF